MSDAVNSADATTKPPFDRCPRCDYPLRGLPANHACPECGLRYDRTCARFAVESKWHAVGPVLLTVGFVLFFVAQLLQVLTSGFHDPFDVAFGLGGLALSAALVWYVRHFLQRARKGYLVAVLVDGLLLRLPGTSDQFIPWDRIECAKKVPLAEDYPQVALISLRDRPSGLHLGGQVNFFPTTDAVVRFVDEVNRRAKNAKGHSLASTPQDAD